MKKRTRILSTFLLIGLFLVSCEPPPESYVPQEQKQEQRVIYPDTDRDSIPDGTEDWVAQTFAPYYIHDEQELANEVRYVYQVTPVRHNDQSRVLFVVVALYDLDWAEISSALDSDTIWHYGDAESIRIYLGYNSSYPDDPDRRFEGEYRVTDALIRRHGHGYSYDSSEFGFRDGTHIELWVSEGKHAMFASSDDCESHEFIGGFDEDCGGGPEWYASLPFSVNVGEVDMPYFQYAEERSELSVFYGERVWDKDYPFCGGYDVGDKRWNYREIPGFDQWPECAGPIADKWFPLYIENED